MTELHAGPLTALLDGVDLRYVRAGDIEVFRRVHVAVRDREWATIPGDPMGLRIEQVADAFEVSFDVRHADSDSIAFDWRGTIRGTSDGVIDFHMDGTARADFEYNRIGICVLHPDEECAGQPFSGRGPDGPVSGRLPDLIGQQPFVDGAYVALFPPVSELAIGLRSGGRAQVAFEGELFETEDQRNWTDASFKTYGTPIALGFPRRARAGQRLSQRAVLSSAGISRPTGARRPGRDVTLRLGPPTGTRLPALGLGPATSSEPFSGAQLAHLRALRPDHLRVDVHPGEAHWEQTVLSALQTSEALDCPLEAALFVRAGDGFADAAGLLLPGRIARVLVFAAGAESATPAETTPPAALAQAREQLQPVLGDTPIGGGTDMHFCELNRTRPRADAMDVVAYSIMPQEHAVDDLSLVEALRPQGETVRSARAFAAGRPIAVSPVTLLPRSPTQQADPRQDSLLGAAWTAGSVKYLAEAGAASVSYYEPAGARGVVQADGEVTPAHAVLAGLSARKRAQVLRCASDDHLRAVGLALGQGDGDATATVLVANLTAGTIACAVGPFAGDRVSLRPGTGESASLPSRDGMTRLELGPHAVAWLDIQLPAPRSR